MKRNGWVGAVLLLGFMGFLMNCGGGSDSDSTYITAYSIETIMPVGATQQYVVGGTYSDSSTHEATTLAAWQSSNPAVATIDPATGLLKAVTPGTTTISQTVGNITSSLSLKVVAGTLTGIAVTPAFPSVPVGVKKQFVALGTFSDNSIHDITSLVTWNSTPPGVASIDSNGLATTLIPGASTISCSLGGVSGSTTMTVTNATLSSLSVTTTSQGGSSVTLPAGVKLQFTATGTFSDASTHNLNSNVTWASTNTAVATVSSLGRVTAVAPGTAQITAISTLPGSAPSASATVTVNTATLASLATAVSVPVGAVQQFGTNTSYSNGTVVDTSQNAFYTSFNTAAATITSTTGVATAKASGLATITANPVNGPIAGLATPAVNLIVSPYFF